MKKISSILTLLVFTSAIYAQFGIKFGLNMANEIKSFSPSDIVSGFSSKNLTGYEIGLNYQVMPKKSGLGCEIGALLSQKGSSFNNTVVDSTKIKKGYNELTYIEIPFNIRYRLTLGFIGVYGIAGIYGAYAISGKTVDETTNKIQDEIYPSFSDHVDYGYNLGAGLELLKKIQLGLNWSQGLKNNLNSISGLPTPSTNSNRVFSVNLVYLF
jgi:opacity protein-like surface antigen